MADVELAKLGDGGDRHDIVEGQAVAGVRLDAVLRGQRGSVGDSAKLGRPLLAVELGIAAGVKLDDRRSKRDRGRDLPLVGLDEQADPDTGRAELVDERRKVMVLSG